MVRICDKWSEKIADYTIKHGKPPALLLVPEEEVRAMYHEVRHLDYPAIGIAEHVRRNVVSFEGTRLGILDEGVAA